MKPKYKMEKRQKELARQQKKEKKKAEKLARKSGSGDDLPLDPSPSGEPAAAERPVVDRTGESSDG